MMPYISIICPAYNEEKHMATCLDSILSQDYPKEKTEVFIVDGNSTDKTAQIIHDYCSKHTFIKYLFNSKKIVPLSMNLAIEQASGDYIIRLDAHAIYPKDYFTKLVTCALKYKTDNVGGLCITDVMIKSPKSIAIKEVLSHRFGVGNSLFRIGTKEPIETDTVVFGCFRKDVFTRFGKYNEKLIRNQDIELNKRIKNGGGRIILDPDIQCTYYARETFKGLMKNNFQNGLWNVLTVYFTKNFNSLSIRHYIPLAFIISLLFPLCLSTIYHPVIWISIISFTSYLILLAKISLSLSIHKTLNIFYVFYSFSLLHFSYGMGSLIGIFQFYKIK